MNKQTKVWLVLSIALSLLALGSACSNSVSDNKGGTNTNATAEAGPYSGPTGTISGVISYNGTPPAPKKIDTTADPVCGQKNPNLMTDDTIVKDGKLANTFVYIKEGTVEGGKNVGAEPGGNRPRRFRAGRHHAVRERVGIQTGHTELAETLEHVALAGCDPTGQGYL